MRIEAHLHEPLKAHLRDWDSYVVLILTADKEEGDIIFFGNTNTNIQLVKIAQSLDAKIECHTSRPRDYHQLIADFSTTPAPPEAIALEDEIPF